MKSPTFILLTIALAASLCRAQAPPSGMADRLNMAVDSKVPRTYPVTVNVSPASPQPIAFEDVVPDGLLKARADLVFSHLQEGYFQWDSISKVNFEPFPGDAIGRCINGLTLLSRALHKPAPANLQEIVRRSPDLHNADGYLGPKLPESRANEDVLAGHNGYFCGLCEYARWTKDAKAIESLRQMSANLFVPCRDAIALYRVDSEAAAKVNWRLSGADIGQLFLLLDGITRSYEQVPSPELKAAIETMIARYHALDLVKINAQTHAMLSATTGILRWYELQRRPEDLAFAVRLYQQYRDLAMTETYENYNWFNRPEWTEACAVVDSFILTVNLWRLTGKASYLEDAHLILFNGLLPGQLRNGGFGCGPCVGPNGICRAKEHKEAPFCCSMRGGEGLARAIQYSYFMDRDTVILAFYADNTAVLRFSDGTCKVREKTGYPHAGTVRLDVLESQVAKPKCLRFLVPAWAVRSSLQVTVNGNNMVPRFVGSFAEIQVQPAAGMVIELQFQQESGPRPALHPDKSPGATRRFRGPLLLGSSADNASEPLTPLLDLFDPAKGTGGEPFVLFPKGKANLADSGANAMDQLAGQPADIAAAPADQRRTGYVHDTSINPFIVTGDGKELGDPMPVYWDGVWHLYALSADFRMVPHFTSTDLVKWVEHKPAMAGKDICTGTVVRHENNYYLFYTDAGPQTIRLVVSDNPWEFDFSKSRLVAEADGSTYRKNTGFFRDAYVFYNEEEKLWWMLIEGRCPEVCAGLLKSKDLFQWTRCEPIFKDKARTYGSCPQIFKQGKLWYLACQDWYNWHYTAENPYGPWTNRGPYLSVAIEAASRFATDGKRQITWGWLANFEQTNKTPGPANVYPPTMRLLNYGGPLCIGREMVFKKDGTMGVRPFPELLAAIRKTDSKVDLFACARKLSGEWKIDAAQRTLQYTGESGGIVLLDLPERNPNYYFEAELEFGSPQTSANIVVRSSDNADRGYGFGLSPAEKKIAIRGFNYRSDGKVLNDKEYAFPGKNRVSLQIFICDNNMEVFVDGQECLSARTIDRTCHKAAIEITGGAATISKPLLHHFKNRKETP